LGNPKTRARRRVNLSLRANFPACARVEYSAAIPWRTAVERDSIARDLTRNAPHMPSTGRKPYTVTDATLYGSGARRLRPPDSLGEPEKQRFST